MTTSLYRVLKTRLVRYIDEDCDESLQQGIAASSNERSDDQIESPSELVASGRTRSLNAVRRFQILIYCSIIILDRIVDSRPSAASLDV